MAARLAGAGALHLARTLESGQTFRWTWQIGDDGTTEATGIVGRHVFRVRQDDRALWLLSPRENEARAHLRDYLGLSPASGGIHGVEASLAADPVVSRVLPHTRGVARLAPAPGAVRIAVIISANNNIPKIRQSVERLARSLGEPIGDRTWAFPSPERLAGARPRTLAACLLGYRAPYVRAAARLVAGGRLHLSTLAGMPFEDARTRLLEVPGVGEKVADCVLLFGLGHTAAFPVDVWVKRAVERLFFRGRPRTPRQIQAFARARFGALGGYAQQHLFCYARARLRVNGKGPHPFTY